MGYGDEGKGTTVDYLVRKFGIRNVLRYNGGCQAAHYVVTDEGVAHCFSQFGSGTFVPGVKTFLSRYVAIDPMYIELEESVLHSKGVVDAFDRLVIDCQCPITTPFHRLINQMSEVARGNNRHGSCGKGVGVTLVDSFNLPKAVLRAGDLKYPDRCKSKLNLFWQMKIDIAEQLYEANPDCPKLKECLETIKRIDVNALTSLYESFAKKVAIKDEEFLLEAVSSQGAVFEGAQGVLLDANLGFYPYVTWSNTTLSNAEEIISKLRADPARVKRVGILRAYFTRHGAGPFVTEDEKLSRRLPDQHNRTNDWQGPFRVGWFDLVAARYALDISGQIDCLSITNVDRLEFARGPKICSAYSVDGELLTSLPAGSREELTGTLSRAVPVYDLYYKDAGQDGSIGYVKYLGARLGVPVSICSFGPTANDKKMITPL